MPHPTAARDAKHGTARRVVTKLAKAAGITVLIATLLVTLATLWVNSPWGRNWIKQEVTTALAPLFRGKLTILEIGWIGFGAAGGVDAVVHDETGRQVLLVQDAEAHIGVLAALSSLLSSHSDIELIFTRARIEHVDALLDTDREGVPFLAQAFQLAHPSQAPQQQPEKAGRSVHLRFARAEIGSAWVHGQIRQLPRLDADLRDTAGAVEVTAQGLVVNVSHATLHERAMVQRAAVNGAGVVALHVPFAEHDPMLIDTSFEGTLGDLPIYLAGTLKGEAVQAKAALSPTAAQSVRAVIPSFPFQYPIAAHLEVGGNLPELNVDCYAEVGASALLASGSLNVGDPIRANLNATIRHFDLRALGSNFPQSTLDGALTAHGQFDGHARGTATMQLEPSRIAKIALPRIHATAEFNDDVISLKGSLADAHDSATFRLETRHERDQYVVAGDLSASSDLSRYTPVAPGLSGQLRLTGAGQLHVGRRPTAEITVLAQAVQVRLGGVAIAKSAANLQLSGLIDDPQLVLGVTNEEVSYKHQRFPRAALLAEGSLSKPSVRVALEGESDRPQLYANAAIQFWPQRVDIMNPHVNLWRGQKYLDVQASKVRLEKGGISIERASAAGSCNPLQFEGRMDHSSIAFKARGRGVQLADIAYVLGRDAQTDAVMDLDVDLHLSPTRALGTLDLDLQQVNIAEIGRGAIAANLKLEQRRVAGAINGAIGPYSLHLQADDFTLAGPAQAIRSWRDATGEITLDANIDLGRLKATLPEGAVPFDLLTGAMALSGRFERTRPAALPELIISAKTRGFSLSRKGTEQPRFDGKVVHAPPQWKVEGVDFEIAARIAGSEGATHFRGRTLDRHGTIATLDFEASVPYRTFTTNPKVALQQLSEQPIHIALSIPRRKMDTLPTVLRVKGIGGEIEGQFELTQERRGIPTATLFVGVHHLQFQQRVDAIPITAEVRLQYLGDRGKMDFKMACADQPTLTGSSEIRAPLNQAIRGQLSNLDWRVLTHVDVSHFPLRAVPVLAERRVQGSLNGSATLGVARHAFPEFNGELEFNELKIADVTYKTGHFTATLRNRSLDTRAELTQMDGGYLTVSARTESGLDTAAQPGQTSSKTGAARMDLRAAGFRASAFQPMLQGTVAELDGLLDAQVNVDSDPVQNVTTGRINFRQGTLQLERFGEEFHGVEGNVILQPGGLVLLEGVRARGVSGQVEIAGKAKMKGFSLSEAHATVRVPKRDPLPVVIEGESMAEAWGNLDLDLTQEPNVTQATVRVHKAGVRIPDKSSHALQELGSPPAIRIGVQRSPTEFVLLPMPPEKNSEVEADSDTVQLTVDLQNVEVRRGTALRTRVDGKLRVMATQTNDVTGKIQLSKGTLDVEGKRFEIERGVITFVGDPTNPEVVVTAGWTAPEGTRVYADFIGPLKTGKVTLRAEPARTQSEILSLILFGTTDGQAVPVSGSQQQTSDPGASGAALGVGGGIATQGLNRALDDITGLDVTTRVDTTNSANPKPEIEVQIAQDVALSIAHVLGTPSAAEGLDRNLLTLDWRFLRNWSLETTFGDQGSVVMDTIWQLRY